MVQTNNSILARFYIPIIRLKLKRCRRRTGVELVPGTKIGKGLRIAHAGSIVMAGSAQIENNCTLHHNVTIGRSFLGGKAACPIVGNNVIIFPGATLLESIKIGNNAIIGASALVLNDVPNGAVVDGIPARIISLDSSNTIPTEWRNYFYYN